MSLLIFPPEKLTPKLRSLLDPSRREEVANDVNEAVLAAQGERREARIRGLVRLRAWAEYKAREAHLNIPETLELGSSSSQPPESQLGEAMIT